jgi:hypothetical protein
VLPGAYTVKLTKGDQVYTAPLQIAIDPRATYNLDDRKAQLDLALKLRDLLGHMTYTVDSITGARDAASLRSSKLPEQDALRARLQKFHDDLDQLRSKIVATKEGGMITGEERIRELLGNVYGNVNSYDGKPTDDQVARTSALARELEDVLTAFRKLTDKDLPGLNAALAKKKLERIPVTSESDWEKQHSGAPGGSSSGIRATARTVETDRFEKD